MTSAKLLSENKTGREGKDRRVERSDMERSEQQSIQLTSSKQSWSCKCQARILHATIGERRREAEDIIATPSIGTGQRLSSDEEFLSLREFKGSSFHSLWFSPHFDTRTDHLAD
jgi:hypothetical protein